MGKTKSDPKTTQKKEPQPAAGLKAPAFGTVMAEMAWQVAVPFMLLALGGSWLDSRFDSDPVLTIVGTFLGLAAVTVIVKRLIEKHYPDTFKKEDKK